MGYRQRIRRGSPILEAEAKLERKGRTAAEVCTSPQRGRLGIFLRRAIGTEPPNEVWPPYKCAPVHRSYRGGVEGRKRPAELGGEQTVYSKEM